MNPIISVAPMMDWTDRHDRFFLRLIAPDILLYTEMITAHALTQGDYKYLLKFNVEEHPVALQIGGSDPKMLADAAKLGEEAGYDEINLNVGCPSPRVKKGRFGACLMLEPELVAAGVAAMIAAVNIPVTVKCRIGVDDQDSYDALKHFINKVSEAGCQQFIIHARKAWLNGLSPKENREIPPLQYETVYQIKKDFPALTICINGGIKTLSDIETHLKHVDGVMIGREAYTNPYFLAVVNAHYFSGDQENIPTRLSVAEKLLPYVARELQTGTRLSAMTRHILGLFKGERGALEWRRYLSTHANLSTADITVLQNAIKKIEEQSNE